MNADAIVYVGNGWLVVRGPSPEDRAAAPDWDEPAGFVAIPKKPRRSQPATDPRPVAVP